MPEHDGFNPRYSPEFQRGYVPSAQGVPRQRADAGEVSAGASPTEGAASGETVARDAGADDTGADVAGGGDSAAEAAGAAAGGGATVAGVGDGSRASAAHSRSSLWRNPYVIALLVAGVLLILGGIQLYFRSIESMYTSRESVPQDLVTVQVFWGMAPVLMTAGAFTVIGVGFLAAYRWRQGRP